MGNNLIKLVQRKRSKESGASNNKKKQIQRNGENPNGMPVGGSSNQDQHLSSSSIFKLHSQCFDELFEYLSLKDLHSLGQTCKSMQQMTGEFFTRNYSAAKINCLSDGIYMVDTKVRIDKCHKFVSIPGFIQFITWIAIENNVVAGKRMKRNPYSINLYYHCNLSKFEYIKLYSDEFKSVKRLSLTNIRLNKRIVDYISNILPNIEMLELAYSTCTQDLYVLLKYCKNVRCIQLTRVTFKNKYKWLLQRYEKLERLELDTNTKDRIDELCTFFERNPNVRSFSCDPETLMSNKYALLNSKVKLDTFELKDNFCKVIEEKPLRDLLNQLHIHGFYKRLHIIIWTDSACNRIELPSIQFLEQLCCSLSYSELAGLEPLSTHLIEYAERAEDNSFRCWKKMKSGKSRNEILVEQLMNVERLRLFRETLDIPLFIKKLRNLKKIKLINFELADILQLDMLNTEREKLAGARKVTIYVPDAVFLATKWNTKNGTTNFSLIEMKRTDSYEWNRSLYALQGMESLYLPPGMK